MHITISSCAVSWKWTVYPKMAIVLPMTCCSILIVFFFCLLIAEVDISVDLLMLQVATKYPGNALPHRPTLLEYVVSSKVCVLLVLLYSYDIGLACTWYYINCLLYILVSLHIIYFTFWLSIGLEGFFTLELFSSSHGWIIIAGENNGTVRCSTIISC